MEKIEVRTEERKFQHVKYYCDGCGKELDSADEYYDGYIPESAYKYVATMIVPSDYERYTKECIYCPDCVKIFESELVKFLELCDFRKE